MQTTTKFTLASLLLATAVACGQTDDQLETVGEEVQSAVEGAAAALDDVADEIPGFVEQLAEVATSIQETPERAVEIMVEHGISRERLDSLVYEIASRDTWTDAFLEALGR